VDLILSNLERLATAAASVTLRVPVIPEFNDTPEDIRAIAERIVSLGITELHLLPYHRLGQNKYRLLGRPYGFAADAKMSDGMLTRFRAVTGDAGLTVRIGG